MPSRPGSRAVSPARHVSCVCGRPCAGRAGLATHGRSCLVERARSRAFTEAIEFGLHRRALDAHVDEAVAAARAGRPHPIVPGAHVVVCSTECGRLSAFPLVTERTGRFYAAKHAAEEPAHVVVVEPATPENVQ